MSKSRAVDTAPAAVVALMLQELGNPFGLAVPPLDSRWLALSLADLYWQKGTDLGIRNAVRWIVGVRVARVDCYNLRDEGESPQVGAGPHTPYSFDVILDEPTTPDVIARVRAVVEFMKPPHTHLVNILPPVEGQ